MVCRDAMVFVSLLTNAKAIEMHVDGMGWVWGAFDSNTFQTLFKLAPKSETRPSWLEFGLELYTTGYCTVGHIRVKHACCTRGDY
jgi:hypothetical protein